MDDRPEQPDWVLTQRSFQGERPPLPEGRAVDRTKLPLLAAGFVRALREAGIEVPIGATLLYVRALCAVNDVNRSARYWCGRTTLITRSEDFMTYHKVFGKYWVGAEFDESEQMTPTTSIAIDQEGEEEGDDGITGDDDGAEPDVTMRYSAVEVLRDKDFSEYTKEEPSAQQDPNRWSASTLSTATCVQAPPRPARSATHGAPSSGERWRGDRPGVSSAE